jgi:hypothetical protein
MTTARFTSQRKQLPNLETLETLPTVSKSTAVRRKLMQDQGGAAEPLACLVSVHLFNAPGSAFHPDLTVRTLHGVCACRRLLRLRTARQLVCQAGEFQRVHVSGRLHVQRKRATTGCPSRSGGYWPDLHGACQPSVWDQREGCGGIGRVLQALLGLTVRLPLLAAAGTPPKTLVPSAR